MNKKALIIGGAATALVLGGTGAAVALTSTSPPTRDQVYLAQLQERDIPIVSEEKALKAAQLVCDAIKSGIPAWMIATELDDDVDSLDGPKALGFVIVTQDNYCPGASK